MNNYTRKETTKFGTNMYYNDKDELHRTDGPAIERVNGSKFWYLNDKLHRTDGPAVIWANGSIEWYLNDKELTEEEVRLLQNEIKIKKALGLINE